LRTKEGVEEMLDSVISELKNIALDGGAEEVKLINPKDIIVAQWVRNKCVYGCQFYGKRFTCPPYSPTVEETSATLQGYREALLVEFTDLSKEIIKNFKKATEIPYNMEKTAFVRGFERAFSYGAGFCTLCPECPAEKLTEPNIFCKKECVQAKKARPSMEAVGIDVFSTVRRFGFELETVKNVEDTYKLFGLVLLR
jgi:predicted metal-binding protein